MALRSLKTYRRIFLIRGDQAGEAAAECRRALRELEVGELSQLHPPRCWAQTPPEGTGLRGMATAGSW